MKQSNRGSIESPERQETQSNPNYRRRRRDTLPAEMVNTPEPGPGSITFDKTHNGAVLIRQCGVFKRGRLFGYLE